MKLKMFFLLICFWGLSACKGKSDVVNKANETLFTEECSQSVDGSKRETTSPSEKSLEKLLKNARTLQETSEKNIAIIPNDRYLLQTTEAQQKKLMEYAGNMTMQKYNVDYRNLLKKEQAVDFIVQYADYFEVGLLWKTEEGKIMLLQEYVSEYWSILTQTNTIMKAKFITDPTLLYGNGYDVCRGILLLDIVQCEDIQSLKSFLNLEGICSTGTYYCVYEVSLSYKDNDLENMWNENGPKTAFSVSKECRIGPWMEYEDEW